MCVYVYAYETRPSSAPFRTAYRSQKSDSLPMCGKTIIITRSRNRAGEKKTNVAGETPSRGDLRVIDLYVYNACILYIIYFWKKRLRPHSVIILLYYNMVTEKYLSDFFFFFCSFCLKKIIKKILWLLLIVTNKPFSVTFFLYIVNCHYCIIYLFIILVLDINFFPYSFNIGRCVCIR